MIFNRFISSRDAKTLKLQSFDEPLGGTHYVLHYDYNSKDQFKFLIPVKNAGGKNVISTVTTSQVGVDVLKIYKICCLITCLICI